MTLLPCEPTVTESPDRAEKVVYWHRELPPLAAELWDRCYEELMANAQARLAQEVTRLGGHYAHVHDESIDTRHDDAAGETWLRGRFSYVLFRKAGQKP
jgi:hypothetical protein